MKRVFWKSESWVINISEKEYARLAIESSDHEVTIINNRTGILRVVTIRQLENQKKTKS